MDLLEQLRLLSNLETPTEKLLRVVLVGQPQLRTLLLDPAMAQLNQRITLRWHMGPLRYRETVAYVRHRLSVASEGRAARLFTVPALRLTHSLAGGVPRLINMIAHRAMLAAFVTREPRITRRSVVRAYKEIKAVPLPGPPRHLPFPCRHPSPISSAGCGHSSPSRAPIRRSTPCSPRGTRGRSATTNPGRPTTSSGSRGGGASRTCGSPAIAARSPSSTCPRCSS